MPCICLKSENVNIDNEGTASKKDLNFWNLSFQIEKTNGEWTDTPLKHIPPSHRRTLLHPPTPPHWNQKYFDLPPKPKIPTPSPSTLAGGANYAELTWNNLNA